MSSRSTAWTERCNTPARLCAARTAHPTQKSWLPRPGRPAFCCARVAAAGAACYTGYKKGGHSHALTRDRPRPALAAGAGAHRGPARGRGVPAGGFPGRRGVLGAAWPARRRADADAAAALPAGHGAGGAVAAVGLPAPAPPAAGRAGRVPCQVVDPGGRGADGAVRRLCRRAAGAADGGRPGRRAGNGAAVAGLAGPERAGRGCRAQRAPAAGGRRPHRGHRRRGPHPHCGTTRSRQPARNAAGHLPHLQCRGADAVHV